MDRVVIVDALRTPVGSFNGSLSSIPATNLGALVIRALVEKHGLEEKVDEVIMSHVLTTGCGQNTARQAARLAGLDDYVPAMTINKVCGGGLKAINLAAQAIIAGDAEIIIAGGHENMSMAPHYLPASRQGKTMGDWVAKDTMIVDGLWDAFHDYHMGITAENIAEQHAISRKLQDEFALASQQKAQKAIEEGKFIDEIIPVTVENRKKSFVFDTDEYPRFNSSIETLSNLKPAFSKTGTITAGNSSGINDGAAALILMKESTALSLHLPILAFYTAFASVGVAPHIMGTGPVPAAIKCLHKAGWYKTELDLIEANEAFASQALYVNKAMGWDIRKVNVNGGAIALGHPIGASGARILTSLVHEMKRQKAKKGLATLCIGGGMGVALAVEGATQ